MCGVYLIYKEWKLIQEIKIISSLYLQVFEKAANSPVLVSFASEPTPIWEIPFPALTICNMNKVDTDIFFSLNVINLVLRCEHLRLRKFSNI